MSPTSEVKPSQVAQLTAENAKLKAENEKLSKLNGRFTVIVDEELISEYTKEVQEDYDKVKEENAELKTVIDKLTKNLNLMITLIKVCDSHKKLVDLKELKTFD